MSTPLAPLQVGVYIDGYNLYYGGRKLMGGPGKPNWKCPSRIGSGRRD
jgi:hypothetical protein